MTDLPEKPAHISQDAWDGVDVPEATDAEFAAAKPFGAVHPDLLQAWQRSRGRPTINGQPKKHIGFRLSADLVDGLRASGKGYNARVEAVLRDAVAKGLL